MLGWTFPPAGIQKKGQWMLLAEYWKQGQIRMGMALPLQFEALRSNKS